MRKLSFLEPLLVAGAFAVLLLGVASAAPAQEEMSMDMEVLDAATCAGCHPDQVEQFAGNPHAILDDPEWGEYGIEGGSCASCHGPGEAHVEAGGGMGNIISYGEDMSPAEITSQCQECHVDAHPRFGLGPHAAAGVSCLGCHSIHQTGHSSVALLDAGDTMTAAAPDMEVGIASRSCVECHGDIWAKFQLNERHRLQEGILDCSSCHDPHGPSNLARLGGFQHQDTCIECHVDKGGPFIFEHASSRVEGCTACHEPHGTVNRHLLKFQDQGELCYSCHGFVPGFHLGDPIRFGKDANCTNCHSTIHGSNFDPFFLK